MTRTKTNLTGLFANLLAPVTDAIQDETGKRLSTAGWLRMARAAVAGLLRILANGVEPKTEAKTQPVAVPAPAPVVVEPGAVVVEPLKLPTIEPVAVMEPVPVAVPVVLKPAKPTRKPKPVAKPEPKAVPMATAARKTKKPTVSKPTARTKGKPTAKPTKANKQLASSARSLKSKRPAKVRIKAKFKPPSV